MDILEKFESEFSNPNKLNFFARKCDGCGQGMNTGYLVTDGYTACSEKCCRKVVGNENFDDAMAEWEEFGDSDYIYWTDWEDLANETDSNGGYFTSAGKLIECTVEEAEEILAKSHYFSHTVKQAEKLISEVTQ
jgi:hypothetical protein